MTLWAFEGTEPDVADDAYVAPTADVIGHVTLGSGTFVGAGAVLRGDYGVIEVGSETSVQENVTVHARDGGETVVGDRVQIGHGSVLHNCVVHDGAVVGLNATVTDYAEVGEWAIVGEGAVVRGEVPAEKIAVGVPAEVVADVGEEHREEWGHYKDAYAHLARKRWPEGLERLGD